MLVRRTEIYHQQSLKHNYYKHRCSFFPKLMSTISMHHTAAHPTVHTYSNSTTPPLTTHLALNVLMALRGQCPCDEYRDAKGRDCVFDLAFAASDQFSRKQLHRATTCFLRRQRPWTNVLGGLHLLCLNHMLGCQWVNSRVEALRWYTSE